MLKRQCNTRQENEYNANTEKALLLREKEQVKLLKIMQRSITELRKPFEAAMRSGRDTRRRRGPGLGDVHNNRVFKYNVLQNRIINMKSPQCEKQGSQCPDTVLFLFSDFFTDAKSTCVRHKQRHQ